MVLIVKFIKNFIIFLWANDNAASYLKTWINRVTDFMFTAWQ